MVSATRAANSGRWPRALGTKIGTSFGAASDSKAGMAEIPFIGRIGSRRVHRNRRSGWAVPLFLITYSIERSRITVALDRPCLGLRTREHTSSLDVAALIALTWMVKGNYVRDGIFS